VEAARLAAQAGSQDIQAVYAQTQTLIHARGAYVKVTG
jgi:hypothetical protein